MNKKPKRVPGDGSLWECRLCEMRHRDPDVHLATFHQMSTSWMTVFTTQDLLSTARKEKRPVKEPTSLQAQTLF